MKREITSLQNKVLKQILSLQDNRTRKKSDEFGVEGIREIASALKNGFEVSKVCISEEILNEEEKKFLEESKLSKDLFWFFSKPCFEKLTVRKGNSGLYLIFKKKNPTSSKLNSKGLYLILDGIEKPANLGAILRTSDASGVNGIYLTNSKVDPYHPHVIRNSLGAAFSVPCFESESETLLDKLEGNQIKVFASYLNPKSKSCYVQNYKKGTAFVLGSEDKGITNFWKQDSIQKIIIPMNGSVDSLNVSVAASILLFEAVRQRIQ